MEVAKRLTTKLTPGFDNNHKKFFTDNLNKSYRVPGFPATSFNEAKSKEFMRRAMAGGNPGVLWTVQVYPAGKDDATWVNPS